MTRLPHRPLALWMLALAGGAQAQTRLEVQATHSRYESRETLPGGLVFNQEHGRLPGMRLGVEQALASDWTWRTRIWHQAQALDYQGLNQLLLPIRTRTHLRVSELALSVGPRQGWPVAGGTLQTEIGLAWQRSARDIQPSPLSLRALEVLSAGRAQAGLNWSFQPLPGARLGVGAQLGWPLHQRLVVETFGALDRYVLTPQQRARTHWQLSGRWPLTAGWALVMQVEATQERFGPSTTVPVQREGRPAGVSSYPGSRHWMRSVALGLDHAL